MLEEAEVEKAVDEEKSVVMRDKVERERERERGSKRISKKREKNTKKGASAGKR